MGSHRIEPSTQRVAYLTGEFPRATDTFIQREVKALQREGLSVKTFAIRRPGADHHTGPLQRELERETSYVLEMARETLPNSLVRALRNPRRMLAAARLAWSTRRPGLRGTIFQFVYLVEAAVLANELVKQDVQHLHNHFADSSCTVAMLTSELSGIPYSFTLHGPGIFFEPHTWQLGAKLDNAAFCCAISNFARSQAAIFASPETMDRVHIVHCGIEPLQLSTVEHGSNSANLIFVGRLVELKGMSMLLDAVARLRNSRENISLTVVGDGEGRKAFEAKANRLGLSQVVNFVGSKSPAEVGQLLAHSDVFVLPSFAEGVPVVIMEALGSALPVVSTFVGGIPELVEDGVNGFLVPPADVDQLTARLEELLDSPELRSRMGHAGRRIVLENFDSTIEAQRLARLFAGAGSLPAGPIRPEPLSS